MAKVTSEPKTEAQSGTPETTTSTNPAKPTPDMAQTVVPDNIAQIFKTYPQYDQLWIDREGGVFVNKPVGSTSAILYKKPAAQKA